LISFGRLEGILTAAHVLDEVKKVDEIGLLAFPVRPTQSQRSRLHFKHVDWVKIAKEPYSERGPDLAFLKLPVKTASELKANSSFVSFQKQSALAFTNPPAETETLDAVIGVIADWCDDEPVAQGPLDVTTIRGLLNVGTATDIDSQDGCDRLQFNPLPTEDFGLPESYGGTSGGGLWREFTQIRSDQKKYLVQLRLLGVAFYQSDVKDGSRSIICHGPKSIYERLPAAIREKWKAEFDDDRS